MSCILEITEVLGYHTFICEVGTELFRSVSTYFYLFLFLHVLVQMQVQLIKKSERCISLGVFSLSLRKRHEKFMLLSKLCPTVDQITFVEKHIPLKNATESMAKYS